MLNGVVALVSVIIAVIALLLTLWQNIITRRAAQASVFVQLEQFGEEFGYNRGIDIISSLKKYDSYSEFCALETEETKKIIYKTVNFLNYCAHLAYQGYIPRQRIWDIYFWDYRICGNKLIPWWLDGVREDNPRRFVTFEKMSKTVCKISNDAIIRWDRKRGIDDAL